MFFKNNKNIDILNDNVKRLINTIDKSNIIELLNILGKKSEIIKRNFLAGIFRGVGIGVGVTIVTAFIVIILQKIVTLNLPGIGKYVTDIVNIVQKNMY